MPCRNTEGEERVKGTGNLFEEIIAENLLNLGEETDSQVQKAECSKQNQPREDYTKMHYN